MLDQTEMLNSINQLKNESIELLKVLHKTSTNLLCLEIRVRFLERNNHK